MRRLLSLAFTIGTAGFSAGCSTADASFGPAPPGGACPVCAPAKARGGILSRQVEEASGLAASVVHPGVLYVHNDSGDRPRFFAMTKTGGDLGAFDLEGAAAFDWEDAARGPCGAAGSQAPASSCLYFGDTGDNRRQRDEYVLYRVPEPASLAPPRQAVAPEVMPFVYPDGQHDAEALLVHPITGVVTIVTKVGSGASPIFELPAPLTPGATAKATLAGEVKPPQGSKRFTAGAVHPGGRGVLLRTYTHIFYYPMTPDQTVAQALAGPACELPSADEGQGESIAWSPSGASYMTVSEGLNPPIFTVACEGLDAP